MATKCISYQSKHSCLWFGCISSLSYPSQACGCKSDQAYFKVKAHIVHINNGWLSSVVTIEDGEQHICVANRLAWPHRRCLLTGRDSLWKQTSPEHNPSIWLFQIADVLLLTAAIRNSVLVNHGVFRDLMRLGNHGVFIMNKNRFFESKQLRSAQHLSCSEKYRRTTSPHAACLSGRTATRSTNR